MPFEGTFFDQGCVHVLIAVYFQAMIFILLNGSVVGVLFARVATAQRRASQIIFSDKAVIRCVRNHFYFMLQARAARRARARTFRGARRRRRRRIPPECGVGGAANGQGALARPARAACDHTASSRRVAVGPPGAPLRPPRRPPLPHPRLATRCRLTRVQVGEASFFDYHPVVEAHVRVYGVLHEQARYKMRGGGGGGGSCRETSTSIASESGADGGEVGGGGSGGAPPPPALKRTTPRQLNGLPDWSWATISVWWSA